MANINHVSVITHINMLVLVLEQAMPEDQVILAVDYIRLVYVRMAMNGTAILEVVN